MRKHSPRRLFTTGGTLIGMFFALHTMFVVGFASMSDGSLLDRWLDTAAEAAFSLPFGLVLWTGIGFVAAGFVKKAWPSRG